MTDRYLEPHQARQRDNTIFEDLLGDSIERAYGENIHDLAGLVSFLNMAGPPCPNATGVWNEQEYTALIARLGE